MEQIIVGVDPGLVHTGLVVLRFDQQARTYQRQFAVINGPDATAALDALSSLVPSVHLHLMEIFIEKYRPRTGFSTNERMMEANTSFRNTLKGALLSNTGVNQIVGKPLLQLLDLWVFGKSTNHDDLRAAARIAVLGMLLDPLLNSVLYSFITDNLEGKPWHVRTS